MFFYILLIRIDYFIYLVYNLTKKGGIAMKKKIYLLTALVSVLAFAFIISSSIDAKVRISKKRITLNVSDKYNLRLKGAKSSVKWKSSNPKVAKVSKKGNVTAIHGGKATITAKTGKKKYKCVVSVKGTDTQSIITPIPNIIVKEPSVPTPTFNMNAPYDTSSPTSTPSMTAPTPTPDALAPTPNFTNAKWIPGEVIIRFEDDCPDSVKSEILKKCNPVDMRDMYQKLYDSLKNQASSDKEELLLLEKDLGKNYIIVLPDKSESAVINAIKLLEKEQYVRYAQPNYIYHMGT